MTIERMTAAQLDDYAIGVVYAELIAEVRASWRDIDALRVELAAERVKPVDERGIRRKERRRCAEFATTRAADAIARAATDPDPGKWNVVATTSLLFADWLTHECDDPECVGNHDRPEGATMAASAVRS